MMFLSVNKIKKSANLKAYPLISSIYSIFSMRLYLYCCLLFAYIQSHYELCACIDVSDSLGVRGAVYKRVQRLAAHPEDRSGCLSWTGCIGQHGLRQVDHYQHSQGSGTHYSS